MNDPSPRVVTMEPGLFMCTTVPTLFYQMAAFAVHFINTRVTALVKKKSGVSVPTEYCMNLVFTVKHVQRESEKPVEVHMPFKEGVCERRWSVPSGPSQMRMSLECVLQSVSIM